MNKYRIAFINGHNSKYTIYETRAANVDQAKEQLFDLYGANFEHVITSIAENEVLIYER